MRSIKIRLYAIKFNIKKKENKIPQQGLACWFLDLGIEENGRRDEAKKTHEEAQPCYFN